MKCNVSAMWMWWSCNEYFYIFVAYLCDLWQNNGVEMNKIYCYTKCGSGGLEMKQKCEILSILMVKMISQQCCAVYSSYIWSICEINVFIMKCLILTCVFCLLTSFLSSCWCSTCPLMFVLA